MKLALSRLIDALPGLIWTAFPDGRAELINRRWAEYTGLAYEQAIGFGWQSAVHPEDRPRLLEAWHTLVESGTGGELEARLRRHDGEYRRFLIAASPIIEPSGRIVRWCGINTDIEERRRGEDKLNALRTSEQFSCSLIDSIPALVAVFTSEGKVEFVNRRTLEYFGSTPGELERWQQGEVVHPEDRSRVFSLFAQAMASGEPFEWENRSRRRDGTYRWLQTIGSPLRDEHGEIVRWYNVLIDIDERKRAEEALKQREAELARAHYHLTEGQRLSHTASFTGNPRADEHTWSDEFYRICEFESGSKATLQRLRDIVHPDDLASFDTVIARSIQGHGFDFTFRIVTPKGALKHLRGVGRVVDHGGDGPVFAGALQDITDNNMREAELRQAQRSLVDAQRLSLTGSYTANLAVDEHVWSDETYRIFELAPGTKISTDIVRDVVHPGDRDSFEAALQRVKEGDDPDQCFRIVTRSGRVKHLHCVGYKTEDDAGQSLVVGAIQDLTERRLAEEALKAREAELATMLGQLTEAQRLSKTGSFMADMVNDVHVWSEECYRLCEMEPGLEIKTQTILGMLHPEDAPAFQQAVTQALAGVAAFTYRIVTPRGVVKHLRGVARRIDRDTNRATIMGAIQDVTESKLAEDALSKARTELAHVTRVMTVSALTASIAHEVNQPLFGIVTNADTCLRMLSANPPNTDGARAQAQRILRDGNRASEVIQRLRAMFARKQPIMEPVDLSDAAREVLALSLSQLQRGRVVVRTDFADGLPIAHGDRVQLQQVILNLILNAADAMMKVDDRPREMLLSTACDGPTEVRLSVRDCGVGVDPRQIQKLFEAFYTTKAHGMGVGLSISRSIIESHSGRLWGIPNDGPGATFSFSIPREPGTMHG
jgi:PAS domain S-box-containing protein